MSSVSQVNGPRVKDRPAGKSRSAHSQDRRDWKRGYEDGYYGRPIDSQGSWYAHGHREGAAAARRRDEIRTEIARDESRATAAPAYARLISGGRPRGHR